MLLRVTQTLIGILIKQMLNTISSFVMNKFVHLFFFIFTIVFSCCTKNTTRDYIPFPPKPTTYEQFHEVVDYYDKGLADPNSTGPKSNWQKVGYTLMVEHGDDTIYSSYLNAMLIDESVKNDGFTDTWIYQNWDSFSENLTGDWSKFEFSDFWKD